MNKSITDKKLSWMLQRLRKNSAKEEIINSSKTIPILEFICSIYDSVDPVVRMQLIQFINNNIFDTSVLKKHFLEEQRQNFFEGLVESTTCPTCDRHAKIYKRKLSSNSIRFLTSLIQQNSLKKEPVHYKECNFGSRDYPALRWWGLAQTYKDSNPKKNWSGYWIPTDKGIEFAKSEIRIPKYLYTYNGEVIDIEVEDETPEIYITDIIGENFDYLELMKESSF
jgi:hypothetical protein|tara:strand:+ start:19579 stop:20250 length:672 start_codon:yes stop_codon:yes gene_type:complete